MAKPTPDEFQQAGEQRLREWDVAEDATPPALAALLHRDPAADVAIAHRLGTVATEESAQLLQALETSATDKRVRKAAKRALYRLEQRGIHTQPDAPAAPTPAIGPALEGYVSPVDGRGDQLVWLLKPQPGGIAHLFAVVNDPDGLREAALSLVTRKALKSLQGELERKHELRLVPVDWHYADFLMHRAFGWARVRGTRMEGDYPALRNQLLRVPAPEDLPPSVLTQTDAATIGEQQLAASPGLIEEPEFRTWLLSPDQAQPLLAELADARDSPLLLNRAQQQDRFDAVITRGTDTIFSQELRASWARRLYEMAYVLAATKRRERAEQAVAVARGLEQGRAPHDLPFCAILIRTSLAIYLELAAEQEKEREKSSLVVTPQQAVRERERR